MREKDLIFQIQKLAQLQPRKDWVVSTKREILGEEKFPVFFLPRTAFVLIGLLVLLGIFGFAQNSLPGDPLYPIKKITEKSQAVFVSEKEKPKIQLEITNKRLEELKEIAKTNQVKNLAPAIKEYQVSVSQAVKEIKKIKKPEEVREVVPEIEKIAKNKEKVEKILATKIDNKEGNSVQELYKVPAEILIGDLEKRTLTKREKELLIEAKSEFEKGNFSQALEILLFIQSK